MCSGKDLCANNRYVLPTNWYLLADLLMSLLGKSFLLALFVFDTRLYRSAEILGHSHALSNREFPIKFAHFYYSNRQLQISQPCHFRLISDFRTLSATSYRQDITWSRFVLQVTIPSCLQRSVLILGLPQVPMQNLVKFRMMSNARYLPSANSFPRCSQRSVQNALRMANFHQVERLELW